MAAPVPPIEVALVLWTAFAASSAPSTTRLPPLPSLPIVISALPPPSMRSPVTVIMVLSATR
jgi:hypothetical protein